MLIPFLDSLDKSSHVLLAGAGGGFDIFAALPLYHSLRSQGKRVSLANLSFTHLLPTTGHHLSPSCVQITAESEAWGSYFPERHLVNFLNSRGESANVFAIYRAGCRPVQQAYHALLAHLQFDTLILVDGGTDSLMRGDEQGLATPEEDAVSMLAARSLPLTQKFHVCVGFGVDHFHGACNAHAFEAIAELTRDGAFRGAFSFPPQTPEFELYRDAVAATHQQMPNQESIVNSSILSAIQGRYGDYHATSRTKGSELNITPLMAIYWAFDLNPVADRLLYKKFIAETETYAQVSLGIETYRATLSQLRPPRRALT